MTIIPKISAALQKKHTGQSAAIVNGKIVAFGRDSVHAEKNALKKKKGFKRKDVMTTCIMGKKHYA